MEFDVRTPEFFSVRLAEADDAGEAADCAACDGSGYWCGCAETWEGRPCEPGECPSPEACPLCFGAGRVPPELEGVTS
jgi:hypothetical protein